MLHLKPVSKHTTDPLVTGLYEDIESAFAVDSVPLLFQYLANFPDFFSYVWSKSVLNLHTHAFSLMADQMIRLASQATQEIYHPSETMQSFVETISPHEVANLKQTANSVIKLNARLLVLTIGIRESIKGVFIGQKLLTGAIHAPQEEVTDDLAALIKPYTPRDAAKPEELRITSSSSFLAPLFSRGLAVSSLPQFFTHIDSEMLRLLKTEKYLEKRVLLEQHAMQASYRLEHPLGASYQEIIRLAGGKPYFHELLYLLVETFPTAYPRMLFTTSVMLCALEKSNSNDSSLIS